jgi:hypothetical protein
MVSTCLTRMTITRKRLTAGLNQFNRSEIFKALQDLTTKQVPFVNLPERRSQHQHAVTEEVMSQVQWLDH